MPLASSFLNSYLSQEIEMRIVVSHTERVYSAQMLIVFCNCGVFVTDFVNGLQRPLIEKRISKRSEGNDERECWHQRNSKRQTKTMSSSDRKQQTTLTMPLNKVSSFINCMLMRISLVKHISMYVSEYFVWHFSQRVAKSTLNLAVKQLQISAT